MIHFIKGIVFQQKTRKRLGSLSAIILILGASNALAQNRFKSPNRDRTILLSVIDQFKRECTHISTIDQNTLDRLQEVHLANREKYSKEQNECYNVNLSQLRGFLVIYQQTCQEVARPKLPEEDTELARIFVNIRTYLTSFRITHKLLSSCLTRAGIPEENQVELSDYGVGTSQVFRKLRSMEVEAPFKEERVNGR